MTATKGHGDCVCRHTHEVHQHYRAGENCSRCPCRNYRAATRWRIVLHRWIARRAARNLDVELAALQNTPPSMEKERRDGAR